MRVVTVSLVAAIMMGAAASGSARAEDMGKGCTQTKPTTQPAPGSADGTAPGNAGSTGWSGGTGGSYIGTAQAGSTSNALQPATAEGLDPLHPPAKQAASC